MHGHSITRFCKVNFTVAVSWSLVWEFVLFKWYSSVASSKDTWKPCSSFYHSHIGTKSLNKIICEIVYDKVLSIYGIFGWSESRIDLQCCKLTINSKREEFSCKSAILAFAVVSYQTSSIRRHVGQKTYHRPMYCVDSTVSYLADSMHSGRDSYCDLCLRVITQTNVYCFIVDK